MTDEPRYSIKAAAARSGLSPHVIRVWERRHQAVSPGRTSTGRRLYSESDVERLRLLREATQTGCNIGSVASLPNDRLAALIPSGAILETQPRPIGAREAPDPSRHFFLNCLSCVERLDAVGLERALTRALVGLGMKALIADVIVDLLETVGDRWADGKLRVPHEHLLSAAVRTFLGSLIRAGGSHPSSPAMVVTTPSGQLHELGALAAAATAAADGWRVIYLGPDLPAEEIAAAVIEAGAAAVALSILYPADDPGLAQEFRRLREYLPESVAVLVGGRAAPSYAAVLKSTGAILVSDLAAFHLELETLRAASLQ